MNQATTILTCSEHQKDDVVRISDVGQALGCLVDFDGVDIGQEVSQQ